MMKKESLNTTLVFWDQRKQTHAHTHAQTTHKPTWARSPPTYISWPSHKNCQMQELHVGIATAQIAPQCWGKGEENRQKCVSTQRHLKRAML